MEGARLRDEYLQRIFRFFLLLVFAYLCIHTALRTLCTFASIFPRIYYARRATRLFLRYRKTVKGAQSVNKYVNKYNIGGH